MGAIDVGTVPANFNNFLVSLRTIIELANPANLSGKLTSVQIWCLTDLVAARVGTFYYQPSDGKYYCRASQAIGAVTAGSTQTFPVSIAIKAGDFIGVYFTAGQIEVHTLGGSGIGYVVGEYIDPGDSAIYDVTTYSIMKIALYGTGVTPPKGWWK